MNKDLSKRSYSYLILFKTINSFVLCFLGKMMKFNLMGVSVLR